jgi:murein DD-endopeptidase MepM/ murein hydrolase activator NlpD
MRFSVYIIMLTILFSSHFAFSAEKKKSNDVDVIENAIIIDSLSLTTNKPLEDDDSKDGNVIYDDSFDDSIIEKSISKNGKILSKDEILDQLKRKDSRWHYTNYKIKKNDSLWGISRKFSTSNKLVIRVNQIKGPDQIREGNELLIPNRNGYFYSVKRGDSLERIGSSSKSSVAMIKEQNPSTVKMLKAGVTIFIPDGIEHKKIEIAKNIKPLNKKDQRTPVSPEQDDARKTVCIKEPVAQRTPKMAFIWPLKGRITSGFGTRSDPFSGKKRFHNGMDISAEVGTPVKAIADGEVIFSGWKDDYGNLVVLRHKNGYVSVYGHNSKLNYEEGAEVKQGDIISLSGMTGLVTGAHLHLEIQKYQTPLNPLRMLK